MFPAQMTRIRYEMDDERFTVALISADGLPKKKKTIGPSEAQWLRFLNRAMARLWNIHDLQQGLKEVLPMAFTRPFLKPQLDYPRVLGYQYGERLSENLRQVLGYNARVPENPDEYYQPVEKRIYQPGQG